MQSEHASRRSSIGSHALKFLTAATHFRVGQLNFARVHLFPTVSPTVKVENGATVFVRIWSLCYFLLTHEWFVYNFLQSSPPFSPKSLEALTHFRFRQ
jgi:hypothetical protein